MCLINQICKHLHQKAPVRRVRGDWGLIAIDVHSYGQEQLHNYRLMLVVWPTIAAAASAYRACRAQGTAQPTTVNYSSFCLPSQPIII